MTQTLIEKRCVPCEGGVPTLTAEQIQLHLKQVKAWQINADQSAIFKRFDFRDYYQTMSFVNAVAWVANQEGHHPDLEVSYNRCVVKYMTHAVGGLTENDFICAAKIDALK
ncbi:MAG: 4a-hydroxytetrahydrobiopterin dehydratase [Gammaproteobacteria bacterium]